MKKTPNHTTFWIRIFEEEFTHPHNNEQTQHAINYLKQLNEYTEKYAETNVMDAANAILTKLNHIDEENKICQDALKMNSLMQGEHLTTTNIEDIDDEAEDILKREAPEKLCEANNLFDTNVGEEQIKVDFDFEDEGKAKPDEIEKLENLNKNNPNCIDLTGETQK